MKMFRKRVVSRDHPDGPLLIRYILFRCKAWGIYLHHLLRSDEERALHDHLWPFVSIVLSGGYVEIHDQTLDRSMFFHWHQPGSVLVRPAQWRHRFALTKPAWTLVIVGRRFRKWGFFVPQPARGGDNWTAWCHWRRYNPMNGICEDHDIFHEGED